jgi:hypothetical protein
VTTSGKDLFGWLSRDEVGFQLPHPPGKCMRRLAKVTTAKGFTWYLDSRTAMESDPRFRGVLFGTSVRIAGVVSPIAAGHVSQLPLVILVPGGLAALVFGMAVAGRRYLAKEIPRLIAEVNAVLDGAPDI